MSISLPGLPTELHAAQARSTRAPTLDIRWVLRLPGRLVRPFQIPWLQAELPLLAALALLSGAMLATLLSAVSWTNLALTAAAMIALVQHVRLQAQRTRALARFLPGSAVAGSRSIAGASGERRYITVLFADLRDSTTLAEELSPEATIQVLNDYVGVLAQCVIDHGGVVDKFLGDGLMALFGLGSNDPTSGAVSAAQAYLAMCQAVENLNAARERPIRFGVGLHTGEVVLGPIGLPERADYTAIGDTVNTAARLSGLCREFDVEAVLSGETAAHLADQAFVLRVLGPAHLRGKTQPVEISTLSALPR